MLRFLGSASLISVALAIPAAAQTGNPAFTPPGTPSAQPGMPAPNRLNTTDRVVIEQLAIGNAAEIELAKLAAQKAHSQAIKDFAQAILHDHDVATNRVTDFATASGVPLPSGLDAEHQALHQRLTKLDGAAFDVAFAQAEVTDHQKALQLLEYEIGSGQESGLRAYAAESLPMIHEHLRMAQSLALGATPHLPQAAAAPPGPTSPPATAPPVGGPTSGPGAAPQTPPTQPR